LSIIIRSDPSRSVSDRSELLAHEKHYFALSGIAPALGECITCGAGFLETSDLDIYKKSAREYVRQLWDGWWPHRDELQRLILAANAWRLTSTRPANHPQRRLAALAVLARDWSRLQRASGKSSRRCGE